MRCPYCNADNDKVVDSRAMSDGSVIRRRRECLECGKRFTTYEQIDNIPLMVVKRDRRREPFNRDKIVASIRIACQKRPISEEQIQELTRRVETELQQRPGKEVESSVIGELVVNYLRELDQVAYVRFASVYRDFKDVRQFAQQIQEILASSENVERHP